jgi:hypothetical protein
MKACPFGMKTMKTVRSKNMKEPSMRKQEKESVVIEDVDDEDEDEASYDYVHPYHEEGNPSTTENTSHNRTETPAKDALEEERLYHENATLRKEIRRLNQVISDLADIIKDKLVVG